MSKIWDQTIIQQYIVNQTQESLILEYKAAAALAKSDGKMKEITKDVSAMANSSGGVILYGVKEYDLPDKKHLPEKIDPIEQELFSREWLEQVINNIRPRIDGLVIHPIPINTAPSHVVYVIEIPQSSTAHQATDWRYYKRYNFQAVPMEDYEVRDTMGRQQFPVIDIGLEVEITTHKSSNMLTNESHVSTAYDLNIRAKNVGKIYAQYVNGFFDIPLPLLSDIKREQIEDDKEAIKVENGKEYYEYYRDNTVRDVVDSQFNIYGSIPKYGPSRYDPILPGLSQAWSIRLCNNFKHINLDTLEIRWTIYADNAPPVQEKIMVKDIIVVDHRKG
jgi:hypothetical protein